MLNQVVLVGRLVRDVEKEEGKNGAILELAIPRSFKNSEGLYETDFIKCRIFDNIATNVKEYCRKGDIVGVKGRLQSRKENEEHIMELIGEKVTFLSSRKENE